LLGFAKLSRDDMDLGVSCQPLPLHRNTFQSDFYGKSSNDVNEIKNRFIEGNNAWTLRLFFGWVRNLRRPHDHQQGRGQEKKPKSTKVL